MNRFWRYYVPDPRLHGDPLISALHAPDALLRRLPPLFLNAAGLDPLLSDTLALVKRLEFLGVRHEFVLHAGVHHGFMQMSARLREAELRSSGPHGLSPRCNRAATIVALKPNL